jgi:hypothetical protein
VVDSSTTVAKGSGSEGARTDEQVPNAVFVSTSDPLVRVETSPGPGAGALDVTLSGHAGIVNRGNICGLLAGCLQDVSFVALVLHIFCFLLFCSLLSIIF